MEHWQTPPIKACWREEWSATLENFAWSILFYPEKPIVPNCPSFCWPYYIAAQLQHLIGYMSPYLTGSAACLMLIGTGVDAFPDGLEAQLFQKPNKPNKQMPTYALLP